MFKKLWKGLKAWWDNQDWVISKWLFPQLDSFFATKLEIYIEDNKQALIRMLNEMSARDLSIKACSWSKDRLKELLKRN